MVLYRITTKAYIHDFSGTGAMLYGGRWNQKGSRLLYTSASLSLAALEIIANLSPDRLGRNFFCVELDFPDSLKITEVDNLPEKWNTYPYTADTVSIGTRFTKNEGLCLKVPSAIIPSEYNYLFNPLHDNFHQVKLIDARHFILNKRLVPGL